METCCPAEEQRLRLRGRTFEDPEQFSHEDESALPSFSQSSRRDGVDNPPSAPGEKNMGRSQGERDQDVETVTNDAEALSVSVPAETEQVEVGSTPSHSHHATSCSVEGGVSFQVDDASQRQGVDGIGSDKVERIAEGTDGEVGGMGRVKQTSADGEDYGASEFRPAAAMSAKAVVRARRQWALRRSKRFEGPNEANQLELGGAPGEGSLLSEGSCTGGNNGAKEEDTAPAADIGVVPLLVSSTSRY